MEMFSAMEKAGLWQFCEKREKNRLKIVKDICFFSGI